MKKLFALLVLCICLLSSCNGKQTINGQVISALSGSDTETVQLVIRDNSGKEIGIVMDAETFVIPLIDDVDDKNFKKGDITDVYIRAECSRFGSSFTGEDGKKLKAYKARYIYIDGILTRNALHLADGSNIDILKHSDSVIYQLNDGTKLLRVQNPHGPENVYTAGVENFDVLSETAKSNILLYYNNLGPLYDVNAELERAYADYRNTQNKPEFNPYFLSQETAVISSNDKVMYFLTSVTLPVYGNHVHELRLGTAFDRETGEYISNWDLFSCSEEEAIKAIFDIAGITDFALRAEMEAAIRPEYIILFQSNLEVTFPRGSLPSQENTYALALDYNDDLRNILNDWAIPE